MSRFLLVLSGLLFLLPATAQINPTLTHFTGPVYNIPLDYQHKAFPTLIQYFDSLGTTTIPELNFSPGDPNGHFPGLGLNMNNCFGIDFRSRLTVHEAGCYEISLGSDDGSRLWLDGEVTIKNDGLHQWRVRKDSVRLTQRTYDVRLWYYNGLGPSGLSLQLDTLADANCPSAPAPVIVDSCAVFFAIADWQLSPAATDTLWAFATRWRERSISKMTVNGYADAVGATAYNQTLSEKRAQTVVAFLREQLPKLAQNIVVAGKGEVEAATKGADQANRRVRVRVVE